MAIKKSKDFYNMIVKTEVGNDNPIMFSYKENKGKFSILPTAIIDMKVGEFRRFLDIVAISENPKVIAGFINVILRKVYNAVIKEAKNIIAVDLATDKLKQELTGYCDKLIKFNDILLKSYEVKNIAIPYVVDVIEEVQKENIKTSENITALKRCNVNRLIPTQVKPIWNNCKMVVKIGYSFEYRGMPLQVVTDKGWVKNDCECKVFIIDPVIGLPITSYDGTLTDLEDKLAEVFIGYLKTIESNKESIVQIANAFKKLKENVA